MMEKLIARGEALARDGEHRAVQSIAAQLRHLFGTSAIAVDETRVLVTGRGIVARWFIEPRFRFLGRGPR